MTSINIDSRVSDLSLYATTMTEGASGTSAKGASAPQGALPDITAGGSGSKTGSLPALSDPTGLAALASLQGVPSLGANALSLVQELSDEQRRANNEQRMQNSLLIVEKLHDQASTMRSQAIANLVMGLVSAGIQISAAAVQTTMSIKAGSEFLHSNAKDDVKVALLQNQNTKIQGITQAINATGTMVGTAKDVTNTFLDAKMKDRDAEIEMVRSYLAQLDSLNDSLKEVIRNARENQNAIQQNMNQTRTKILS